MEREKFREWIEGFLEKIPDNALINCCIKMSYTLFTGGNIHSPSKKEIMVSGLHPNDEEWQKKYPSTMSCWGGTPDGLAGVDTAEVIRQLEEDGDYSTVRIQRLRDVVEFAIAAIDSNHCYMGEEAQVDLRDYLKEMIESDKHN